MYYQSLKLSTFQFLWKRNHFKVSNANISKQTAWSDKLRPENFNISKLQSLSRKTKQTCDLKSPMQIKLLKNSFQKSLILFENVLKSQISTNFFHHWKWRVRNLNNKKTAESHFKRSITFPITLNPYNFNIYKVRELWMH